MIILKCCFPCLRQLPSEPLVFSCCTNFHYTEGWILWQTLHFNWLTRCNCWPIWILYLPSSWTSHGYLNPMPIVVMRCSMKGLNKWSRAWCTQNRSITFFSDGSLTICGFCFFFDILLCFCFEHGCSFYISADNTTAAMWQCWFWCNWCVEQAPTETCNRLAAFHLTSLFSVVGFVLLIHIASVTGEGANYGVDINTGGIADSFANFVWEPSVVKVILVCFCHL